MGVASLPQRLLVWWGSSVEDGLTGGEPGEPVVDTLRDGPDDAGRVVAVPVDVLGDSARLHVWPVGLAGNVQGHIQEVDRLLVGLRPGDLQPVGGKDPADLLLGDLILPFGESACGQEVVAVQAYVQALALQLAEEEEPYYIAAFCAIKCAHTDVKFGVLLLDPYGEPLK